MMRLNGYPILHSAPHREHATPGRMTGLLAVIAFREADFEPFVVATWAPDMGTTWHQGEYFATLPDALDAFRHRAQSGSI